MATSVVAVASAAPGGVGTFELTATTGLIGIGMSSGAAAAVIIFRLATYWLPVPPGWLAWRLLQRMDYV
jgi:undecaprenyl-diphosphatase